MASYFFIVTVKAALQGTVTFKAETDGVVHVPIGNVSFTDEQLKENLRAVMVSTMMVVLYE